MNTLKQICLKDKIDIRIKKTVVNELIEKKDIKVLNEYIGNDIQWQEYCYRKLFN